MRFSNVALSTLLFGATALAAQLNDRFIQEEQLDALMKRQTFKPTTTTAEGATCADAFGAGYVTCREASSSVNRLCYNPDLGQTCCSSSWACPSGSVCLVNGSCCPASTDPKVCAAQNSVSIPANFTTPTAGSATKGSAAPTGSKAASGSAQTQSRQAGSLVGLIGLLAGAMALL